MFFGDWYARYAANAVRPGWYTDDVRTVIFAYLRFEQPEAYRNDLIGDYALAIMPPLHRAVFTVAGWLHAVGRLSQLLPLLLFGVTLVGVGATARRLGGFGAGLLAIVLVTGSSYYLERMAGGLPRAFAFPFVAWALFCAVSGRYRTFAVLVVLAGGFYPSSGFLLGLGLTSLLVIFGRVTGASPQLPSLRSRALLLLGTVVLATVVLAPMILSASEWGARLGSEDIATYPEAGPGGTQGLGDRPPWQSAVAVAFETYRIALFGTGRYWPAPQALLGDFVLVDLVLGFIGFGVVWRCRRDEASRRLGAVLFGVFVAHILGRMFYPAFFSPTRAIQYGLPLILVVVLAVLAADIGRGVASRVRPSWAPLGAVVSAALIGTMVAGKANSRAGFVFQLTDRDLALYRAIDTLEPSTVIAGWPDDPMSHVSWLTHRQAFMTGEMHLPFHAGYLDAVRERLDAFFAAYLAVDPEPVVALRERFGVTHLLVDRRHFRSDPPAYMQPFRAQLAALKRKARRRYLLPKLEGTAAVWSDDRFVVLDLRKL